MNSTYIVGEKYEINVEKEIGSGPYGKIFECNFIANGKFGTFQQLCAKIIQVADERKQVHNEKSILELIQQQKFNINLVKVYWVSYEEKQKKLVVIMEKCTSNLEKELKNKQQFSDIELLDFLEQFINGYQILYDNNIIHRDLKPENILINTFNNQKSIYKIADFGTGKIYKQNDFLFTQIGTPVYASPETNPSIQDQTLKEKIVYNNKQDTHFKSRVDIYSLGIILHQLYFGSLPFQTSSLKIIEFQKGLKANPFKINQSVNRSQQIIQLIESMIQYYPDQRISFPDLQRKCQEMKQRYSFQNQPPQNPFVPQFRQEIRPNNFPINNPIPQYCKVIKNYSQKLLQN